ncbi:hypothetical protein R6Z07F_005817 [Ovis aries]
MVVVMWHTRSIAHRRRPPPSIPMLGRQQAVQGSRERKHVRRKASWEELGGGSTGPTTYPIIQHTTKTGSPGASGRLAAWDLWRRGLACPALAPALERNMYRFRSQLFTGISAAAIAHSYPRRFSPLLLAEDSPLSRPSHRRTSKKCSSIG